ncbi:cell division protein FtsW [Lapidilactobacillus concavus]|uniref:FtsW/RodA/SpoVE family cell cycle protein n=1 Tax=Lapidilactobacillus concavus TaxID=287844 RepID=UPI00070D37A2|nr:FtsW/RodA/SpoVE family cell cycle protein [Lapidilactobacillus concavus]GEL13317.1 cell division protein FtsW [Lapidilactobacillus concavus]
MKKKLQHLDYWILLPYLALVLIGIVMVYSASSAELLTLRSSPFTYVIRQIAFAVVGLFLLFFCYFMKIHLWYSRRFVIILLVLTFLSLLGLQVLRIIHPAAAQNGAVGWYDFGFFNVQPVEPAKLSLVLYFAFILGRKEMFLRRNNYLKTLWPPVVIALGVMFLTLLQPDMGGAAILGFIVAVMLFASGIPWIVSLGVGGILLVGLGTAINFLGQLSSSSLILKVLHLRLYQFDRLRAFMHPFALEKHGGAQLVNSYYAINNGGWFGRGLGNSIQKRGYLPEPYTDFILSITAEELGVIGASIILLLIGLLIVRSFLIGMRSHNTYHMLICYGISAMLFVQTLFNVGGLLGLLPITGVTLPFISYGGSSMLVLSVCIGLVLNVSASEQRLRESQVPSSLS